MSIGSRKITDALSRFYFRLIWFHIRFVSFFLEQFAH